MPSFNGDSTHSTTLVGSGSTARTNGDLSGSSQPDGLVDARTTIFPVDRSRDHTVNSSRGIQRDGIPKRMDQRSPERTSRMKQKSEFYGDAFAYRESLTSAQDRISRSSAIIVEIKTNVIVSIFPNAFFALVTPGLSPSSE